MLNDAIYEEISSDEETNLSKQLKDLLLKLESDLKILKDDSGEDLSEHFKELEELKKVDLSVIEIKDVTDFLKTNIFSLMIVLSEVFNLKPLTIYGCMLKSVRSFPKTAYQEHLQVLLDLKTEETRELLLLIKDERKERKQKSFLPNEEKKQQVSIRSFFSILSDEKTKKRGNLEDVESTARHKRLRKISPLALPNNLD